MIWTSRGKAPVVFRLWIDKILQPHCLANTGQLSFTQTLDLKVNKLILDPSFFEVPFRFFCVKTLFGTENLDIHLLSPPNS